MKERAVIVLPTYNEAGSINQILTAIFDVAKDIQKWDLHVLVVDSASDDGTADKVKKIQKDLKNVHLLSTKKEGLGKAYIQGFQEAIDTLKAEVIFQMDADLSHDPKMIPYFLEHIDNGADFVIGSRYIKGGSIPSDWALHRKIFSVLGNLIIRLGFMHLKITDWTSGYRCIRSWVVKSVLEKVDSYTGYVFQVAILDNAKKSGAKIAEVPIQFVDRTHGESKIDSIEYILQTLFYVFFESSFVKFVIVGGTGFIIDSIILYILALELHLPPWFAKLISAEAAIISNFTLNNFWSFSHKQINSGKKSYVKGLVKFNIVSAGNIIIQMIGIQTLSSLFGKDMILVYNVLIILFFVIPYSYVFYNKFIWKDKKVKTE